MKFNMPHYSNMSRKVQPAKKAWKRLTSSIKSNLQKLNIPKAIKIIKSSTKNIITYCFFHIFLPFKKKLLNFNKNNNRPSTYNYPYSHEYYCNYNYLQQYYNNNSNNVRLGYTKNTTSSAVYIDQLYASERVMNINDHVGTSKDKEGKMGLDQKRVLASKEETSSSSSSSSNCDSSKRINDKEVQKSGSSKNLFSVEDAWRDIVAKSPQLRPVDERAEEFIYKFRQDMRLQKERSKERSMLEF